MTMYRFFVSAAAVLAFGFTATAQVTASKTARSPFMACKAMLPENNPGLSQEIKELAEQAATACLASIDERRAAQQKFEAVTKAWLATVDDPKSDPADILGLTAEYIKAFNGIQNAEWPMQELSARVALKYFDGVIAHAKAGLPLNKEALAAHEKWQEAALAAESNATLDNHLFASADEVVRAREAAKDAVFKEADEKFREMMRREREMMRHESDDATLVCVDGSKPSDGFCADGTVPVQQKTKKQ